VELSSFEEDAKSSATAASLTSVVSSAGCGDSAKRTSGLAAKVARSRGIASVGAARERARANALAALSFVGAGVAKDGALVAAPAGGSAMPWGFVLPAARGKLVAADWLPEVREAAPTCWYARSVAMSTIHKSLLFPRSSVIPVGLPPPAEIVQLPTSEPESVY
jgi:hypothetical protein